MKNEIADINEVIIRFLEGTATNEEKVFLSDWLKLSENNRNDFSEVRDLWLLGSTIATNDIETEIALDRFKERIHMSTSKQQVRNYTFGKPMKSFLKAAAVLLLLVSVGSTFYYLGSNSTTPQITVMNQLITANGSKGRFILPDSTVVWLNANSSLEYPKEFTASAREVHLSGEAYFEVHRNEKHPFRVHAGKMNIEVLGTRFVVKNYEKKATVETVLVEGTVKVEGCNMNHSVVLTPGQLISYNRRSEQIDLKTVTATDYISWIQKELIFDNDKLADIIINLEKWYGIDINCSPVFAKQVHMSFSIRSGEDLNDILKAMTLVAPISYHWKNEILYIVPKK